MHYMRVPRISKDSHSRQFINGDRAVVLIYNTGDSLYSVAQRFKI